MDQPGTFAAHLEELRRRLAISFLALLIGAGLSLTQAGRLMQWLQQPIAPLVPRFAYFTPTEPLLAYLKVAMLGGWVLAMPVILGQLWAFVQAGLTAKERALGVALICWGSLLFLAGGAFAYFLLLPVSLRVLLGIGSTFLVPIISIDRYLSFVTSLVFSCGLVFELPIVIVVLAKIGIVTPEWLRQQRPYAILVLAIVAAVVTPTTDPINMLLLMAPLVVLYELSIWVARLVNTRAAK